MPIRFRAALARGPSAVGAHTVPARKTGRSVGAQPPHVGHLTRGRGTWHTRSARADNNPGEREVKYMPKKIALKYIMCSKEAAVAAAKPSGPVALKYIMCSVQGAELTLKETADLLDQKKGSVALKYIMCSKEA